MPLQAILFDCDGVIADSEALWNQIDAAMLSHFDRPGYQGEYKEFVLGKSFELSLGFYRDRFAIEASIEEMLVERTLIGTDYYANRVPTFEGARECLQELRALGLKLALATSSVSPLILPFLRRHALEECFDAIVTGEMVTKGKPHPDIYLEAAARVSAAPAHCLVVEDALAGLQAGRAAGARTVAIPDERWGDINHFVGAADYVVSSIGEVTPLVRKLLQESSAVG